MHKLINFGALFLSFSILSGCSPDFEGEDLKRAQALIKTNMICSTMVKYHVGQLSVLALDGDRHDELIARLQSLTDGYLTNDFRERLDEAMSDDLETLFKLSDSESYEVYIKKLYLDIQRKLQEQKGYSYPDCDMAIAMSESLIEGNSYW